MRPIYLNAVSIPLILIWMTLIDSGSAQCSCYSFDGSPLRTWLEARKLCKDNIGELVSMETLGEWEFIKTQIQTKTNGADNEWWIGLEMRRDGSWEWLSNQTLAYNKWQYTKPDDRDKRLIHVIIAQNFPSGTYGLFRNKVSGTKRGTICEYKGPENCRSDLNRVSWCPPTTAPSSRKTATSANTPSHTTKITYATTRANVAATGNDSPVPHHSTFSTNGPVKESRKSFPTAIVASVIGVILLSTCIVILVCIWKRKRQERKPRRNSHLNKKSRVPVKLEHSVSSNANDLINSSDVTIVSDNALQPEPAYASLNDHQVNVTDGTSKEAVPVYASVRKNKAREQQQTNPNQASMSHVIYAELNDQAATQNSCHENKEPDNISYENEVNTMDDQSPHAKEGIQTEDNRLVYAQLAEFKYSDQQQSSTKMPSPYECTEYATIMTPILSNLSKSRENVTQI